MENAQDEECHFIIEVKKAGEVKFGERVKNKTSLRIFRKAQSGTATDTPRLRGQENHMHWNRNKVVSLLLPWNMSNQEPFLFPDP